MSRRVGLLLLAFVVAAAPAFGGEIWRPEIEGSVRAIVSGRGERPPLYALTREVREEDKEEEDEAEEEDGEQEEDDDEEREWTIQRWDPTAPGSFIPLIDIPPTKLRPQLGVVQASSSDSLSLVIGSDLWLFPLDDLDSGSRRALGRPSFTDPSPAGRLLKADPRAPRAYAAGIGEAEIFDLSSSKSIRARLPTDVRRRKTGLLLQSPRFQTLGAENLFVAGPQSLGNLRLRTLLVEADSEPLEAWSLLPGPERLEDSRYEWIDGRPFLFCVTLRADKQGFFERKKFRVFDLLSDRTRGGHPPLFERLTSSRMWQPLQTHLVDVDLDGMRDLVLLQPEGWSGKKLIVDVFLALSPGRFDDRPLRTVIPDLKEGGKMLYGTDWTSDQVPDLVILREGRVEVFAGLKTLKKKSVIEREPSRTLRLGQSESAPTRLEEHGGWLVAYGSGAVAVLDLDP